METTPRRNASEIQLFFPASENNFLSQRKTTSKCNPIYKPYCPAEAGSGHNNFNLWVQAGNRERGIVVVRDDLPPLEIKTNFLWYDQQPSPPSLTSSEEDSNGEVTMTTNEIRSPPFHLAYPGRQKLIHYTSDTRKDPLSPRECFKDLNNNLSTRRLTRGLKRKLEKSDEYEGPIDPTSVSPPSKHPKLEDNHSWNESLGLSQNENQVPKGRGRKKTKNGKQNQGKPVKVRSCRYCDFTAEESLELKEHVRKKHVGDKRFKCAQCPLSFDTFSNIKSHVLTHCEEKALQCEVCPYATNRKQDLIKHKVRKHEMDEDKPFPCQICHQAFPSRRQQLTHMRLHTDDV